MSRPTSYWRWGYRQAEDEFCERIVELAENGRITLAIPSFSVGESYETSYRRKKERESLCERIYAGDTPNSATPPTMIYWRTVFKR